ncbi:Cytochrome P450 4F12 [Fusarium oxysporum f. sp. cubense]|uniref:Cytochrome P450 4F12 n=1 Tax=Fusarium oxysporum f. sp. cubense TaxID=61366 RepID=A0A559KLI1_FUSOC|nr:Cytochrome P450 4F12 [Fusarium oxysporum f. sp. cubense]
MASPLLLIGAIGLPIIILLQWLVTYARTVLKVRRNGHPAIHSGIMIFESVIRSWYPRVPVLVPMEKFTLKDPFKKFANARSDMIVITEASSPNGVAYLFGSPKIFREIGRNGDIFLKPLEKIRYRMLNTFGLQLASTQNGAQHERHKRVVKAVFNNELMENGWHNMRNMWRALLREEGVYPAAANFETAPIVRDMKSTMLKVTLGAIGASWFDIDIPWDPAEESQRNTKSDLMPFAETLKVVWDSPFVQTMLPLWFLEWSPSLYLRRAGWAQRSLVAHIKNAQAETRQRIEDMKDNAEVQGRPRKYRNLIDALVDSQNDVEKAEKAEKGYVAPNVGLSDKEVQGNIFSFMVTGHETSSHTLTWVLSLLARNTDWQEKLYAEVSKVDTLPLDEDESVGDAKPLKYFGYEEMANFPLVLAATIESLRMRDLAMQMTRVASRDTTLSYTTWDGDAANPSEAKVHQHTVAIPKGTRVHLDTAAFGVNPFKWEDPQTYNPTRHLRETEDVNGNKKVTVRLYSPSPPSVQTEKKLLNQVLTFPTTQVSYEDFIGYSSGSRQCIGKRFAEVTMVCFLAHMIMNFRWEVVPEPGETQEQAKVRASTGSEQFMLTPPAYDLRFIRR